MSDLIAELRKMEKELERLTAELALFHSYYGGKQSLTVERNELIAERDQAVATLVAMHKAFNDRGEYVNRLRAALERIRDYDGRTAKNWPGASEVAREALAGPGTEAYEREYQKEEWNKP